MAPTAEYAFGAVSYINFSPMIIFRTLILSVTSSSLLAITFFFHKIAQNFSFVQCAAGRTAHTCIYINSSTYTYIYISTSTRGKIL